jgi:O-antigen ligase
LEKSNPSGVFAFFATLIAVAILTSYARGMTIVMLAFLCFCIAGFVIHQFRTVTEHRRPVVAIAMVVIFGFFLKVGMQTVQSREAWHRLRQVATEQDASYEARKIATEASLQMLGDHWRQGMGSGSFRFLFPIYQQRFPSIYNPGGSPMWWEHAHNDIVQFPIELGLTGTLILLGGIGYILLALLKSYFWENPLCIAIVAGLAALLASSWWDFPFQNPAILMLAAILFVASLMWARFEETNARS